MQKQQNLERYRYDLIPSNQSDQIILKKSDEITFPELLPDEIASDKIASTESSSDQCAVDPMEYTESSFDQITSTKSLSDQIASTKSPLDIWIKTSIQIGELVETYKHRIGDLEHWYFDHRKLFKEIVKLLKEFSDSNHLWNELRHEAGQIMEKLINRLFSFFSHSKHDRVNTLIF